MKNKTRRQVLSLSKSPPQINFKTNNKNPTFLPISIILLHFQLEKGRGIGGKFMPSFSRGLSAFSFALAEATLGKKSFSGEPPAAEKDLK